MAGAIAVKLKTSRTRYARGAKALTAWLGQVKNEYPLPNIWRMLAAKMKGHYNYSGVSGNFEAVQRFYHHAHWQAFKWMNRRSQRKCWDWPQCAAYLEEHPLPKPRLSYAIYNTW